MSRKLSRFTCHHLRNYCFTQPNLSQLHYSLPIKTNNYHIEYGSPAHLGPHSGAIDYIVKPKTPVLAARNGKIIEVVDQHSIPLFLRIKGSYWPTRFFRGSMNYITIQHNDKKIEEFSLYGHLKKNSAKVKIGQKVKTGQIIAQTGWSGWMDKPHLHFVVYTEKTKQFKKESHESLAPRWQNQS